MKPERHDFRQQQPGALHLRRPHQLGQRLGVAALHHVAVSVRGQSFQVELKRLSLVTVLSHHEVQFSFRSAPQVGMVGRGEGSERVSRDDVLQVDTAQRNGIHEAHVLVQRAIEEGDVAKLARHQTAWVHADL